MIQHVDRAVERFLRREGQLAESVVDVSFDAPDKTWGASRTRPTINCFLWEVIKNASFLRAGMEQRSRADGRIEVRRTQPVVDLHYLITAWATEYSDEHRMLGTVLEAVLATPVMPQDLLPEPMRESRCGMGLASHERRVPGELWTALEGRLKPGVQLEITLPIDVFEWSLAAPVPGSVSAGVSRGVPAPSPPAVSPMRRRRAGGALVSEGKPDGKPESKQPD